MTLLAVSSLQPQQGSFVRFESGSTSKTWKSITDQSVENTPYAYYDGVDIWLNHAIASKIQTLKSQNAGLGGRLERYIELCMLNESYEASKRQFFIALQVLEVILERNLGFLWDSRTGEIQIQYEKKHDDTLVIIAFSGTAILVTDEIDEYEFRDVERFRESFPLCLS